MIPTDCSPTPCPLKANQRKRPSILSFFLFSSSLFLFFIWGTRWQEESRWDSTTQRYGVNVFLRDVHITESNVEAEKSGREEAFRYFTEKEEEDFIETCGYWVNKSKTWTSSLREDDLYSPADPSSPFHIRGMQVRSGFGDRLSGLITMWSHAMNKNLPFVIYWRDFTLGFQVNSYMLQNSTHGYGKIVPVAPWKKIFANLKAQGKKQMQICPKKSFYKCPFKLHVEDNCPVYARACVQPEYCEAMKEYHVATRWQLLQRLIPEASRSLTMTEVIGCPLRTMLTPSPSLFDFELSWFIDGVVVNGSLQDLLQEMQGYRIISVHLRMGDLAFLKGSYSNKLKPVKEVSSSCLDTMEANMGQKGTYSFWAAKPVKWFIASDDIKLRQYFMNKHSSKAIVIQHKPHHLDYILRRTTRERKYEMNSMLAEWFLIGRGEELLTNEAHDFGISSFSRTSWLYHLKETYFSIDTRDLSKENASSMALQQCIRKPFEYVGNLDLIASPCRRES